MNDRKLGALRPEKKYRSEILEANSFEQVCDMLYRYLSGEITIRSDPKRGYAKNNRKKPDANK